MIRVVFFGDAQSFISTVLFKSFANTLNDDFDLVAIINTNSTKYKSNFKVRLLNYLYVISNLSLRVLSLDLFKSFERYSLPNVDFIEADNINDEDFVNKIKKYNPDYAFLMGCPQIVRPLLLKSFKAVINYHNSFLPAYRGLEATSWEMTRKELNSGFTFHFVNEFIDDGNILIQKKVQIDYNLSSLHNELIKTKIAASQINDLLINVAASYKGKKQIGKASYFGNREKRELLTFTVFDDVDKVSNLIKIWGGVFLKSSGKTLWITKIDSLGKVRQIAHLYPFIYFFIKGEIIYFFRVWCQSK